VKKLVGTTLLTLTACLTVGATGTQEKQLTAAVIRADKMSIVASNVSLTSEQSQVFWPLYHEYQQELLALNDRMALLIRDYAQHYQMMTDEKAAALLAGLMSIERDELKLRETYLKKFKKALPMKVVARYFQVENKLDAIVQYEISAQIPLMK
jgi:hypothetical protein